MGALALHLSVGTYQPWQLPQIPSMDAIDRQNWWCILTIQVLGFSNVLIKRIIIKNFTKAARD